MKGTNSPIDIKSTPSLYRVGGVKQPMAADSRALGDQVSEIFSDAPEDSLIEALTVEGEMEVVGEIPLALKKPDSAGSSATDDLKPEETTLALDVNLNDGENAVVLVEEDGRFSWYSPQQGTGAGAPVREGQTQRRQVSFTVDLAAVGQTDTSRSVARISGVGKNLKAKLFENVRVFVLKFAARVAVSQMTAFLERKVSRGIVVMGGEGVEKWKNLNALGDVADFAPPEGRPPRVLLFVHGTFSDTRGSFGDLTAFRFLKDARKKHDLVIGFDHPTVSVTPETNAIDLLNALESAPWIKGAQFDGVAFSRGGLVLRSLIEMLLPGHATGIQFKSAVFVGCTNAGTLLAEPSKWEVFLDTYTNLFVNGARMSSLVGSPGKHWASRIASGLSAFAKYVLTEAVERNGAPGISAMKPDSKTVTVLNKILPGQPLPGEIDYFAITSNYENEAGDQESQSEILKRIALAGADPLIDDLMGSENDLVVPIRSMTNLGARSGEYFKEVFNFKTNNWIFHTVYFTHPKTANKLRDFLEIGGKKDDLGEVSRGVPDANRGMVDSFQEVKSHSEARTATAMGAGSVHAEPPTTKINLVMEWNDIVHADGDVFAVGHYDDVLPVNAEYVLDCIASGQPSLYNFGIKFREQSPGPKGESDEEFWDRARKAYEAETGGKFLIRDLTERGLIDGRVGRVQFFPWGTGGAADRRRLIAICGMGSPGRFDLSHLRQVYRNLAHTVDQMAHRKTLTTLLIGAGIGGHPVESALRAMLLGIDDALGGRPGGQRRSGIQTIRIVEFYKSRALAAGHFLQEFVKSEEKARESGTQFLTGLEIRSVKFAKPRNESGDCNGYISNEHQWCYLLAAAHDIVNGAEGADEKDNEAIERLKERVIADKDADVDKDKLEAAIEQALNYKSAAEEEEESAISDREIKVARMAQVLSEAGRSTVNDPNPSRISVTRERGAGGVFHVSAMSDSAAVPERVFKGDPGIVRALTSQIHELGERKEEVDDLGNLLSTLLVPAEFEEVLDGKIPMIIEVDRQTAPIHWEILGHRSRSRFANAGTPETLPLGLRRPVSRQLRTTYSSAPVFRKSKGEVARALVIGDPGDPEKGHNLPGAREEAFRVRNFLTDFGVEVTALIGAENADGTSDAVGEKPASRIAVLRALRENDFDMIHYAGHGTFDTRKKGGWLFKGGLLTANTLERLDLVPPLVFANACFSAKTAEAEEAPGVSRFLPSLADEFFRRGVRHYIGTAWAISDAGAILFAKRFYGALLTEEKTIGDAMFEARNLVSKDYGSLWAAYQHYGMPIFKWELR